MAPEASVWRRRRRFQLPAATSYSPRASRNRQEAAAVEVSGNALGVAAHAVDERVARHCIDIALERFGSVDILVNNAGTNPSFGPVIDQDHARFTKTFDVNLWAPILWTSLAARAWMTQHGGVVINTASIGGMGFEADLGLYNASKAALIHLTKQLALELSPSCESTRSRRVWCGPSSWRPCGKSMNAG